MAGNIFKRKRAGLVAKREGSYFESRLAHECARSRWAVIKFPSGCEWVSANRAKPVKTPFDFVFVKGGLSIYGDAKTTSTKNWTFSSNTPHQLYWLNYIETHGGVAGYVVNFREQNVTVFFTAGQLSSLRPNCSLSASDGIMIGTNEEICLDRIIDVLEKKRHDGRTTP